MDEPTPPPQKLPPWVKKEILLPVLGVFLVGSIFGNYLVYRAIKKEGRLDATKYGPMDRRPMPGNQPLNQAVVDTGREFAETNGIVRFDATSFTGMTGAWQAVKDGGRNVIRANGSRSQMSPGPPMYLSYRIHFTTIGRYRLWGLMRSAGTGISEDIQIYWNRKPGGDIREDYELKVESTNYAWSAAFKDLTPPVPDSEGPSNRDFAENGLPVTAPGTYTLYIAKVEEPVTANQTTETDTRIFVLDQFVMKNVELGNGPPN